MQSLLAARLVAAAGYVLPSVLIVLSGAGCAAHYQGNVTLEDQHVLEPEVSAAGTTPAPSRYATRPPVCNGDLQMPDYPPELLGPEAPVVRVRVDFLLTDEGAPEKIVPSFAAGDEETDASSTTDAPADPPTNLERGAGGPPPAERENEGSPLLLEAAEAAISQWRCQPAWRPPLPTEPTAWVPLAYRTWVVFRFDAERVDRKAAIEAKR